MTAGIPSLEAHGTVEVGKPSTTAQRLTALEKRVDALQERADTLAADLRQETDARQAADEEERLAREATDEEVQRLVKRVTAGNFGRQVASVVLIVAGLLLTNLSEEIARFLS